MTVDVVTVGTCQERSARAPSTNRDSTAPTPPGGCAGALTERVRTSSSPARAERASSVRTSPIPGSTTVVPNRDRNPSAAEPHRPRAWERSWRQARVRSPWPPPSLTTAGRSGIGAMLATSSRASTTGAARAPAPGPGPDGAADRA